MPNPLSHAYQNSFSQTLTSNLLDNINYQTRYLTSLLDEMDSIARLESASNTSRVLQMINRGEVTAAVAPNMLSEAVRQDIAKIPIPKGTDEPEYHLYLSKLEQILKRAQRANQALNNIYGIALVSDISKQMEEIVNIRYELKDHRSVKPKIIATHLAQMRKHQQQMTKEVKQESPPSLPEGATETKAASLKWLQTSSYPLLARPANMEQALAIINSWPATCMIKDRARMAHDLFALGVQAEIVACQERFRSDPTRAKDTTALLKHIDEIDSILYRAQMVKKSELDAKYPKHAGVLKDELSKAKLYFAERRKYLDKAVEPRVYAVKRPKWYCGSKKTTMLQVAQSRKAIAAKVVGGIAVGVIVVGLLALGGGRAGAGAATPIPFDLSSLAALNIGPAVKPRREDEFKSTDRLRSEGEFEHTDQLQSVGVVPLPDEAISFSSIGYTAKEDIPQQDILGEVMYDPVTKQFVFDASKFPGRSEKTSAEEIDYIVECRPPEDLAANGTGHMLDPANRTPSADNPRGHIMIFQDLKTAIEFAGNPRHRDGRRYDPLVGWGRTHDVTDEQIQHVQQRKDQREQKSTAEAVESKAKQETQTSLEIESGPRHRM